jgi:hypothetical protein
MKPEYTRTLTPAVAVDHHRFSSVTDDDVLNENWINYRMVRSHGSAVTVTVLVAIGVGRRIPKT